MTPYEGLSEIRYMYSIGWFKVGGKGLIGQCLVHHAMEKVKLIQERVKVAHSHQNLTPMLGEWS